MARREQDREDLLAEATALVERVSLQLPGDAGPTVVGFRRDGSASFYFGSGCVYQFTSAGELRRAFAGDLLLKATGGKLVSLRRERAAGAVTLVSHELDAAETSAFLAEMHLALAGLGRALRDRSATQLGRVPDDVDVAGRVQAWLEQNAHRIAIAASPRAG
jgi:hypothetical protein